jgi:DNA recombination protein RmuC
MSILVVILAVAVMALVVALVVATRRPPVDEARLLRGLVATNEAQLRSQHDLAASELEKRQQAVESMVEPIAESLGQIGSQLEHLEISRREAYAGLSQQVRSLHETQELLRDQTGNLVTALRSPQARGRWGEIQLRRVVEMAGMLPHCDFEEQSTVATDAGRIRPDVVVHLPGGKSVVVDAKVALDAYLEAVESADDATCKAKLVQHARQVRAHVDRLAAKSYWTQFSDAPDFVVLFIPGDSLLAGALEHDAALMEYAVANKVLLATPVTLIALLRAVAYGWQQEALADNARQIAEVGREMEERVHTFVNHFGKLGRNLDRAVEAFNDAAGSLEHRVLVQTRRFTELGVSETELPAPAPIDKRARSVAGMAPERVLEADDAVDRGEEDDGGLFALEA